RPAVVIIGRSNVGKSTLFNRIAEQSRALVMAESGTTRDRLEADINWNKSIFTLVDTGGLDPTKTDFYKEDIIKQSQAAQAQAVVIVFVVDATIGLVPAERDIAKKLRQSGKNVIVAANKCDNAKIRSASAVFHKLNWPMETVSAKNGSGVGDLLDLIISHLPEAVPSEAEPFLTLALLGKPNVGKSSLLNSMYGEERMIVSPRPHTTRDSQDVLVRHQDVVYRVIDTAGIRRYSHQGEAVEELSINKSRQAMHRADVVGLVIDISKNLTSQDKRLSEEIVAANKGIFIIANKWDLIPEKDSATIERYQDYIDGLLPWLKWAPIIFVSALDNQRTNKILELAHDIFQNLNKQTTPEELVDFLKNIVIKRKPTTGKGTRRPTLLALDQVNVNPPHFLVTIPNKTQLAETYRQFMVNSLRHDFNLEGVPVKLTVVTKVSK
ncbi:MAG: ribosome biogenesis GTPase Der, partial [Candidatus Komeilibacteria bacterium]|nr:ribosome biogenesis GTPase Der [Candidatus Komeilibacteria bacterium]